MAALSANQNMCDGPFWCDGGCEDWIVHQRSHQYSIVQRSTKHQHQCTRDSTNISTPRFTFLQMFNGIATKHNTASTDFNVFFRVYRNGKGSQKKHVISGIAQITFFIVS